MSLEAVKTYVPKVLPAAWMKAPEYEKVYEATKNTRLTQVAPEEIETAYQKRTKAIARITGNADRNKLPIMFVIYGSSAYMGPDGYSQDLDAYLIAGKKTIATYGINLLHEKLGLPNDGMETSHKQTEGLASGKFDAVRFDTSIEGTKATLIWTTTENICSAISSLGMHDIIQMYATGYPFKRDTDKVVSVRGDLLYVPRIVEDVAGIGKKRTFPGQRKLENGITVMPYIINQLLICDIPYDETGSTLKHQLEGTLWSSVVRAVLHYNDLYDDLGKPLEKAYDPNYIYNLFVRRQWFGDYAKKRLQEHYYKELDRIKSLPIPKKNILSNFSDRKS